jgi:Ca2+-binding EF-hand superfamily protein
MLCGHDGAILLPVPCTRTGLKQLFMSIDEDKSGTITVEEMRKALQSWGHKINELELKQLMQIADVDGDGLIDYNEVIAGKKKWAGCRQVM